MIRPKAGEHKLDPFSQCCLGCGATASDLYEVEKLCPALWRTIGPGVLALITEDECLTLFDEQGNTFVAFSLTQMAMFELRDFIDGGVSELRRSGKSKAMPA